MTRDETLERIKCSQWYHSIDVEDGLVTPGAHSQAELMHTLERLQLPARLDGLSVLDIGAWDGYFSFEAERRGARRVVACDVAPSDYFGFATARELRGSTVEYVHGSVYDLRKEDVGTFDIVLLAGVPYHLRYPPLAPAWIHAICDGYRLPESDCLDTFVVLDGGRVTSLEPNDPGLERIPLFPFYPATELNCDYSTWFAPNRR